MKPYNAYKSVKKKYISISPFLFILLLFNILILLVNNNRFKIPEVLFEKTFNLFNEKLNIKTGDITYIFPRKLEFKNINLFNYDKEILEINDVLLDLSVVDLIFLKSDFINKLSCKRIQSKEYFGGTEIKDLYLYKEQSMLHGRVLFHNKNYDIRLKTILDRKKSVNLFNTLRQNVDLFLDNKSGMVNKPDFFDENQTLSIDSVLEITDTIRLECSTNDLVGLSKEDLKGLMQIYFDDDIVVLKSKICIENFGFKKPNFSFSASKILSNIELSYGITNGLDLNLCTSIQNPHSFNLIEGRLPDLYLSALGSPEDYTLDIIGDSNYSKFYFQYDHNLEISNFTGGVSLIPKFCELRKISSRNPTRIIDGEYFYLKLVPTPSNHLKDLFHFNSLAEEFSVLQSPPGNFNLRGKMQSNYDIQIEDAFGRFGNSTVEGNFSQQFNPALYEFVVDGYCIPTDLNQWMPLWWENIWLDFNFSKNIPKGKFFISGTWGENSPTAKTEGTVETSDFTFRDLNVTESSIDIIIDSNQTVVNCHSLIHNNGEINGSLYFPRKNKNTPYSLEFDFEGDYPLNEGRNLFGKSVISEISEINATLIECKAVGKIVKPEFDEVDHHLILDIYETENFKFKDIPIQEIKGTISYKEKIISGEIEHFSIANGDAHLSFDLNKKSTPNTLNFSTNLKKIDTREFLELIPDELFSSDFNRSFYESTTDENISKESQGIFDLSLQAKGPLSDFSQFKGSGILELKQDNLGQIGILTPLVSAFSSTLRSIKLPLIEKLYSPIFQKLELTVPSLLSPSLSLAEMKAYFTLDKDVIEFSPMLLNGKTVSIESKGKYDLSSNKIQISGKVNPVGSFSIPGIKELTKPISEILQFNATGTWEDPKFEWMPPKLSN